MGEMNKDLSLSLKLFFLLALAAVVLFYAFFPLDWGLMDDSEYVLAIRHHLANGWLTGTFSRMMEHAELDLRTGIFRPSFWWYTALAYQLPMRLAYVSRFLEYLAVIGSALFLLRSAFQKYSPEIRASLVFVSLFALISIRALYDGVAFFSLQEFSGLFFVSLAYALYGAEIRERVGWVRLFIVFLLLILGVGFKPPFVWVYPLFAAGLFFHEKRRVTGFAVLLFGIGYFLFTVRLAQTGFYSQQIYKFDAMRIVDSVVSFGKHFAPVALVLLAGALALRLQLTKERKFALSRTQWIGLQMLGAGLMYVATLLPRGVGKGVGYYFGPPIYLIAVGALLSISIVTEKVDKRAAPKFRMGFALAGLMAAAIFLYSLGTFVQRNLGVAEFKRWARVNNAGEVVVGVNSGEIVHRLPEIYFLNFGEEWRGRMVNLTVFDPAAKGATHYLVFSDQVQPAREWMRDLVWERGSAKLFRLPN